jgi:hypothetical protein
MELPTELKKRGVHDVFHSSLLKIHLPNDDRLFPGRQDSQLEHGPKIEEEWAVDKILLHHSTKGDIPFKIKWEARNITWLPSYEISHLQVLKNYLDAHGVDDISQLPPGKGNPLVSDPQIFLDCIRFQLSTSRLHPEELLKCTANHSFFPESTYPMSLIPSPITNHHLVDLKIDLHCAIIDMGKRQQMPLNIAHP